MKNVILAWVLSVSFLFASMDLNSASKKELMSIKGIGAKKADLIIQHRQKNKINSVDDLSAIKGFGPKLIKKIKTSVKG
jgi:competence protein ComEA